MLLTTPARTVRWLGLAMVALCVSVATPALAGPDDTGDALERLEELLEMRLDDGTLSSAEVLPAMVVRLEPRYEASEGWFAARALDVLSRTFDRSGLRLCEACMAPRAYVEEGRMIYQSGPIGLDEIVRLDEQTRGDGEPARSAIWIDEHRGGVSIRIVDVSTGRVLYAQNVDPSLIEDRNSARLYTMSQELERRARGDSLLQIFGDFAIYPGQHISVDFTDQWGKTNANFSGVTFSLLDPVVGIGGVHARRVPIVNSLIGAKAIISLPTAVVASVSEDGGDVVDPLLTLTGFVRVPFGRSNYGVVASGSTNGQFGVGISLMNIRFLPLLP